LRPVSINPKHAETCAGIFKALAHPLRLRIVATLSMGEVHVSELAERLNARQPAVSQQLRILRMSNLVDVTRRNGLAVYSLSNPALCELIQCVEACSGS